MRAKHHEMEAEQTVLKKVMRGMTTTHCRAMTAMLVLASRGVAGAPIKQDGEIVHRSYEEGWNEGVPKAADGVARVTVIGASGASRRRVGRFDR